MDIHLNSNLNLEEVAKLHQADLNVQHKYGVNYQRYWVNEGIGTVFCLMRGPSKDACIAVHKESHGQVACNIIEVQPGDYKHYLGQFDLSIKDRAYINRDEPDTGFRVFVCFNLISSQLVYYTKARNAILKQLKKRFGSLLKHVGDEVSCVFTSISEALAVAMSVNDQLTKPPFSTVIDLSIGISAADPVGQQHQQFFSGAISLAKQLSEIAGPGNIILSKTVSELIIRDGDYGHLEVVKRINESEEKFLKHLAEVTHQNLGKQTFNVRELGKIMGLSRSQFYRKVVNLTGYTPKEYIKEQRMRIALRQIRSGSGSISEIAYQLGFNSPSYFTKSFAKRFGSVPSRILPTEN